jgi:hypothetical protein
LGDKSGDAGKKEQEDIFPPEVETANEKDN